MSDDNVTKVTEQHADTKPQNGFELSQGRFARDPEAARIAGAKGGPKGAATRKKRRLMREAARDLLALDPALLPGVETLADILAGTGATEQTLADALLLAQALKAARGDTEAARFVRDTAGERPADQINLVPGEVVDVDAVAEMTDAQLAELAAARDPEALPAAVDVAPGVAPAAEQEPETL